MADKSYLNIKVDITGEAVIFGNYDGLTMLGKFVDHLLDPRLKAPANISLKSHECGGEELNVDKNEKNIIHHLKICRVE